MASRLNNFLELNSIICPNQFGFRSGFSTEHSLICITECIKKTIEEKKYGCGVFIDLKKAFDTVNHQILLLKLEHYGIRNESLKWFHSYLLDRKQYVSINGTKSDITTVKCGVPQGSVLGPLLFLLYINDLPNISSKLKIFLFADDTNIYLDSNDLNKLEYDMNKELKNLFNWLGVNRLSLNIDKTNFVLFHSINKPKISITIKINKLAILEVKYVKYLGILIDKHLSFKQHINELNKKIARSTGILFKLKPFVTPKILIDVYYAIIYPFLLYGVIIWGSACNTFLLPIHILQKTIVRLITSNIRPNTTPGPLPHSPPLFYQLKLLNIFDIYKAKLGKFVYESSTNSKRNFVQFNRSYEIHNYGTRYACQGNYFIKYSRTNKYGLNSIQSSGSKLWSMIPLSIQNSVSKYSFKRQFKDYLLNIYRYM